MSPYHTDGILSKLSCLFFYLNICSQTCIRQPLLEPSEVVVLERWSSYKKSVSSKKLTKFGRSWQVLDFFPTVNVLQEIKGFFCFCLFVCLFVFLIGIHAIQDWKATTRHGVTRKRNTKRAQHTWNV